MYLAASHTAGSKSRSPQHRPHRSRSRGFCELLAEAFASLSPRELRRRDSEHPLEASQQREPAQSDRRRQRIQRRSDSNPNAAFGGATMATPLLWILERLAALARSAGRRETLPPPPPRRLRRSEHSSVKDAGWRSSAGNRFQSIAQRTRTLRRRSCLAREPAAIPRRCRCP